MSQEDIKKQLEVYANDTRIGSKEKEVKDYLNQVKDSEGIKTIIDGLEGPRKRSVKDIAYALFGWEKQKIEIVSLPEVSERLKADEQRLRGAYNNSRVEQPAAAVLSHAGMNIEEILEGIDRTAESLNKNEENLNKYITEAKKKGYNKELEDKIKKLAGKYHGKRFVEYLKGFLE